MNRQLFTRRNSRSSRDMSSSRLNHPLLSSVQNDSSSEDTDSQQKNSLHGKRTMPTSNGSQASTSDVLGYHLATVEDLSESCLTSLNSFEEDSAYGSCGKNSAGSWKTNTADKTTAATPANEKIERFDYGQLSLRSLRNKEPGWCHVNLVFEFNKTVKISIGLPD